MIDRREREGIRLLCGSHPEPGPYYIIARLLDELEATEEELDSVRKAMFEIQRRIEHIEYERRVVIERMSALADYQERLLGKGVE